jgi:hypothetical protein
VTDPLKIHPIRVEARAPNPPAESDPARAGHPVQLTARQALLAALARLQQRRSQEDGD